MGICQWEKNMKNAKASERFVQNLLLVMPDWHSKLVKPFRDTLDNEMSLETYYCLEYSHHFGTGPSDEGTQAADDKIGGQAEPKQVCGTGAGHG